jgi:hypothetical protein
VTNRATAVPGRGFVLLHLPRDTVDKPIGGSDGVAKQQRAKGGEARRVYGQLVASGHRKLNPVTGGEPDPLDLLVTEFRERRAGGEKLSIRQFCGAHALSQKQFEGRLRRAAQDAEAGSAEADGADRRPSPVEAALAYYARPDVRDALFLWAKGRRLAQHYGQHVHFRGFRRPEDVSLLAAARGGAKPSFHASVGRYEGDRLVAFDLVAEVDHKGDWRKCFRVTRPLLYALQEAGVTFLVKFSGHSSAHIVVPCRGQNYAGYADVFLPRVRALLTRTNRLDLSFHRAQHFLRMPYALNEGTGLVSLPLLPDEYDRFDPEMARPENVGPARLDYLRAVLDADNSAWVTQGRTLP